MESNAHDHLDDVAAARAALAERLVTPRWYLPSMGAAIAVVALGLGIGVPRGVPFGIVGLVASIALPFLLVRRTGISYSGGVRGRHHRWLWALLVVIVVSLGAAAVIGFSGLSPWWVLVPAVLVVVAVVALGRGYERALGRAVRESA